MHALRGNTKVNYPNASVVAQPVAVVVLVVIVVVAAIAFNCQCPAVPLFVFKRVCGPFDPAKECTYK